MRLPSFHRAVLLLVWSLGPWLPAQGLLPEVQERTLKNGVRVLLVERPGTGSVQARLFIGAGRASTGALPAAASDLMARCLFKPPIEGAARNAKDVESALKQEEGAFESLRLEGLKRTRRSLPDLSGEAQGLEQLHRQALARIQGLAAGTPSMDPLEGLGAGGQDLRVEADLIAFGLDLPRENIGAYCRLVAARLKTPLLARFPLERDRFLGMLEEDPARTRDRRALDTLLEAALPGSPYARVCDVQRARIEALTWSDLRSYAQWAVAPERLILVLVGDLNLPGIAPTLDQTLGGLAAGPTGFGHPGDEPVELLDGAGARRLQVSAPADFRLMLGWNIPAMTHPDRPALAVLAQLLGGGPASRLARRVMGDRTLVRTLSVKLDVPGSRDVNLLAIEAEPAERHGLAEVEQALQGELLDVQRGIFREGEIRRAQTQVEMDQLMVQEDAAELAQAMGTAVCRGGDWRLAFRALQADRDFTQQEIQRVALKYLAASRSTTVFLEPDPLLMPLDPIEAQTAKVLARILAGKLQDPAQVESVVRETLRQLRMLPMSEREQTLRLFEAQVTP